MQTAPSVADCTERRAKDRRLMADLLRDALTCAGCEVREEPTNSILPRRIRLEVRVPGGAMCWPEFNGHTTQPDVHVITWNMDRHVEGKGFPLSFGNVNPFHQRNASRVFYGYFGLRDGLVQDVRRLLDGSGYTTLQEKPRREVRALDTGR